MNSKADAENVDQPDDVICIDDDHLKTCPSQSYFQGLFDRLANELALLKGKIEASNQPTTMDAMHKLSEENGLLREHLKNAQEKQQQLTEERDSLKLVVSILSKELHQTKSNLAVPVEENIAISNASPLEMPSNNSNNNDQPKANKKKKKTKKSNATAQPR